MDPMEAAIRSMEEGLAHGDGGPFGAAITDKEGHIVAASHNKVLSSHDPTAHAEVSAIRDACARLGTHDLSDCALYTTAFPCPMCLAAASWANISEIVYAAGVGGAAGAGFRDAEMYRGLDGGGHGLCFSDGEISYMGIRIRQAPKANVDDLMREYSGETY